MEDTTSLIDLRIASLMADKILVCASNYLDFVEACDTLFLNRKKSSYLLDYSHLSETTYQNPVLIIYKIDEKRHEKIRLANEFRRYYQGAIYYA